MIKEKLLELSIAIEDIKLDILELRESDSIKDNKEKLEELYSDFEKLGNELIKLRLKTSEYLPKTNI